ncbi:tyrosine-type recombinase/integrase [Brevundimonas sp.]|uniref:tyrosine-type recombinase/integrase n=2 Tax=Brevundimonas sp. TaxID=1871086 RepID=UPI003BAB3E0C
MATTLTQGWELTKRAKDGIFLVTFFDADGKRKRLSTGARSEREAYAKAPQIVAGKTAKQIAKVELVTKADPEIVQPVMTMNDIFDHCEKTVWRNHRAMHTLKSNVRILRRICGYDLVTEMHYMRLEEIQDQLFKLGGRKGKKRAAPGTVKRKMDTLSKALSTATRMQGPDKKPILFAKPPMPSLVVNNLQDRVLTDAEIAAIFKVIEARHLAQPGANWKRFGYFVRFLLDTACRKGEALMVEDSWIEERPDGMVFIHWPQYLPGVVGPDGQPVHTTKNGQPKSLPASKAIKDMLPFLRMNAVNGRLFPQHKSTMDLKWIEVRKAVKKTGMNIDDVKFHTLRHTKITALVKAGKELPKVSKFAGHSNIGITMKRYAHLSPNDLAGLVD